MYVVIGASGNTGNVVAQTLIDHGKKVRAVGRTAEHLHALTDRGAEAFLAGVTETEKLT